MTDFSDKTNGSAIQSVQRAVAILRSFTRIESELSVTTLSEQLGLHKSTVSRLLSTLQHEGLVEQNPENGKYRLGLTLVTLAGIVLERLNLPQVAQPYLTLLAETTQETVNVVILDGRECVNVSGVASPRPIQYIGRIGRRTPLHCTAAGKVLLACLPSDRQRKLLPSVLPRFTDKTIGDGQALEQELAQVRERGYGRSDEEHQEGVSAIAAPIYDHTGQVVAALTISGPTYRMNLDEVETFIIPVRNAAEAISAHLGYLKSSSI